MIPPEGTGNAGYTISSVNDVWNAYQAWGERTAVDNAKFMLNMRGITPDSPNYEQQLQDEILSTNDLMESYQMMLPVGKVGQIGKAATPLLSKLWNGVKGFFGKGAGSSIKFGSTTKSAQKLSNQMTKRGWTENTVRDTVDNAFTTRSSTNLANNNPATAYFNKDGSYVVVDNVTKEVVQVGNKLDHNWIPDSNIVNPYKP